LQGVSYVSLKQDVQTQIQKETQISRSKSFNLQMLVLTSLPAMYFWMFADDYSFHSQFGFNATGWLIVFSLIPVFYSLSLAFEQIHAKVVFRGFCRLLPLCSVGLWKLVFATFL